MESGQRKPSGRSIARRAVESFSRRTRCSENPIWNLSVSLESTGLRLPSMERPWSPAGVTAPCKRWISSRQSSLLRRMVGLLRKEATSYYLGDVKDTDYFWGDLCREHIRYVRNWTFSCLNMLEVNPEMPYRLSGTPYVNLWFSTADAPDVGDFVRLLTQENVDRLEDAGGLCIISTHFGKGFVKDGVLDPRVHRIFQTLSQKPGWYV